MAISMGVRHVHLPDKLLAADRKTKCCFIKQARKVNVKQEQFQEFFDSYVTSHRRLIKNIGRENIREKKLLVYLPYKYTERYRSIFQRLDVYKFLGLIIEIIVMYENRKIKKVSRSRTRRGNHKRVYVSGYRRRNLHKEDEFK